jgi:HEAT repeat protein
VPALVGVLQDPAEAVRLAPGKALERIAGGPGDGAILEQAERAVHGAISPLIAGLRDPDRRVRRRAADPRVPAPAEMPVG